MRMGRASDLLSINDRKRLSWPDRLIVPHSRGEVTGAGNMAASEIALLPQSGHLQRVGLAPKLAWKPPFARPPDATPW